MENKRFFVQLVGGPLAGRSIAVDGNKVLGDTIEVSASREHHGPMMVETKAHYRLAASLDPHTKSVVGNWVNPAERRQYYDH